MNFIEKQESRIIAVLLVIGFLLRYLFVADLAIWGDEFVFYNTALNFLKGTGELFPGDNNGVLYTLILLALFKFVSTSVVVARLPSVIFGSLSVYMVYLLGKKTYNRYVGLVAAVLNIFSLMLIYWSRVLRNYSFFEFFFLLFLLCLYMFVEPKKLATNNKYLKKFNIDIPSFLYVLGSFILAFLSHQLVFLSFFALSFYLGVMGVKTIFMKSEKNVVKYRYVGLVSLLVILLLVISPMFLEFTRSVLNLLLHQEIVDWIVPDIDRLKYLWESAPYKVYDVYKDVMLYDVGVILLWLAGLGVLLGLIKNFKPMLYLFSFFIIPFVLMSFVFREAFAPRYFVYLLPLIHLFVGVFIYELYKMISYRFSFFKRKKGVLLFSGVVLLLLLSQVKYKEVYSLVSVKLRSGNLVDKRLAQWFFMDYKYGASYVNHFKKEGDVIFATHINSGKHYLGDSVIQFRQIYYDRKAKKFKNYPESERYSEYGRNMNTIKKLYEENERGWLLADQSYFRNKLTSDEARKWVFSHMRYHKKGTIDGGVQIFRWDKSKKVPRYQVIVEDIGKSDVAHFSAEYNVVVKDKSNLKINLVSENIDNDEEGVMILNRKYRLKLKKNTVFNKPQLFSIPIDEKYFVEGNNLVQFFYNKDLPRKEEKEKGFIIYGFNFSKQ